MQSQIERTCKSVNSEGIKIIKNDRRINDMECIPVKHRFNYLQRKTEAFLLVLATIFWL